MGSFNVRIASAILVTVLLLVATSNYEALAAWGLYWSAIAVTVLLIRRDRWKQKS